ncbi:MAG: hypothetical protein PWQ37_1793 [Candidatus Petromonas sp.]|jgi:predicted DNA-binding protein YlxM (UPF0122 family)|nr:hypothetical protein [Candidatus Petromonas sp.]
MFDFILKVLLVAITVAFLGAWGIRKQQGKTKELIDKLYQKAEKRVLTELQKHNELSKQQIEDVIRGTKASLFWSKQQVQVIDPKVMSKDLIKKMIEKDKITEKFNKGKKVYTLK